MPPTGPRPSHRDPESPELWLRIAMAMALVATPLLLVARLLHSRAVFWAAVVLGIPALTGWLLCPLLAIAVSFSRGRWR